MTKKPEKKYLKDYSPPDFFIDEVKLHVNLDENHTLVTASLSCRRNNGQKNLVLNGEELKLRSIKLDGRLLREDEYETGPETLTIFAVPDSFVLEIETEINPGANTSLDGLYFAGNMFSTQCEAEGFRKITYFLDRPDVMARYTTTIEADRSLPVLLANGNLLEKGELPGNRHFAVWSDPFPKPCYLFAMVAGDLVRINGRFTTMSGRLVTLHIYVQEHNRKSCDHALRSLQKAMAWDEKVFGREYDLDLYMIVAVDNFNMGAMENKGLNIFNSKYVLARPETATDLDYEMIEAVIAHEYFHNWTGNRITCRDWFQLSLKEGLTVFRDQEFTADMTSRPVKRINDVRMLRNFQFPEDSGPMAHPVRPDSYIEINNFYTVTVYEKGAEVIRMIHTLLGRENFRKGMDLYFARHDGQAVTTEDFVKAMEDASGVDLGRFRRWYGQAGTPLLSCCAAYDQEKKRYTLKVSQSCPPTPGRSEKKPFHIPFKVGLLWGNGNENSRLLEIREPEENFVFNDIPEPPIPSLLRDFSAPVRVEFSYSDDDLRFLLAHDSDPFSRWEAGRRYFCRIIIRLVTDLEAGLDLRLSPEVEETFASLLALNGRLDAAFLTQLLTLPSEKYLGEQLDIIMVDEIHQAREFVRRSLARSLFHELLEVYHANADLSPYLYNPVLAGQRSLKNLSLSYLMLLNEDSVLDICFRQYDGSNNMTDIIQAFSALVHNRDCPERSAVLVHFANKWRRERLVIDKWFAIQAAAPRPDTLAEVKSLLSHPDFDLRNPNRVRALIGTFCGANISCFHEESGAGYEFLADQVTALDSLNPQIAARMLAPLSRWRRFDLRRRQLMKKKLERILAANPSRDVYEVAAKSLGQE